MGIEVADCHFSKEGFAACPVSKLAVGCSRKCLFDGSQGSPAQRTQRTQQCRPTVQRDATWLLAKSETLGSVPSDGPCCNAEPCQCCFAGASFWKH